MNDIITITLAIACLVIAAVAIGFVLRTRRMLEGGGGTTGSIDWQSTWPTSVAPWTPSCRT